MTLIMKFRTPALPLSHPASLIATWFGTGLVPKGGGTSGSFFTLPFAWVIHGLWGWQGLIVFAAVAFGVGVGASNRYMAAGGSHDPNEIVIDEVSGQALLLAALPHSITTYILGFILFRVFDVLKPWPICWCDKHVHGGLGVMFDDILAALYPILLYGAGMLLFDLPTPTEWPDV